ncbi:MAG TPA: hypothetical protein VKM55_08080 [Candidatus Lokiarchaeia archaeon]|nr:hypothetical protein [Candidatus Lokiarchaeia archaeon]
MKELFRARDRASVDAKAKGLKVKIMALREFDLVRHIFSGDHAQQYETSMLWRVGQAWGVDLVDVSGCHEGMELIPRYQIDDENIPIREPEEWMWSKDLLDPEKCSVDYGEFLISRIATGLASEILETMHEQGLDYDPPSPIPELL